VLFADPRAGSLLIQVPVLSKRVRYRMAKAIAATTGIVKTGVLLVEIRN
jgi:hypothetical protein